jgi:hypothetical protein
MRLTTLAQAYEGTEPTLTATLDVSRADESGQTDLDLRWQGLRTELAAAGAPDDMLDRAGAILTRPTGLGGSWGRTVAMTAEDVTVDRLLPGRPRAHGAYGSLPHLMPLCESTASDLPHAVVVIDRTGADITVSAASGGWEETVQGTDEYITRVQAGGWSHLRYHHTAENQWAANAKQVAHRLDELVRSAGLAFVVVAGDVRATQLLRDAVAEGTRKLLHVVESGGRGPGADDEALMTKVDSVREHLALQRAEGQAGRFVEQLNRDDKAAAGLDATMQALRRAQVDVLIVPPHWDDHRPAWFGPDPTQVALRSEELGDLGVREPRSSTVTDVVLRAVAGTDAELEVVPEHVLGLHAEPAGILRYSDEATAHGGTGREM